MTFSSGLVELVLIVDDVPRAAAFYRDVVGLRPYSDHNDAWAWFWTGAVGDVTAGRLALHRGSLLHEEHTPRPTPDGSSPFGQVHCAFRVTSDRIDEALETLRRNNVAIHGPNDLDWMNARSWYFYDPDGNLLEYWMPRD